VKLVKNGHDYKGSQKYHCKTCGRYGTLQAQRGYAPLSHAQVKRGVLERLSLRGLERMLKVSRRTLSRWLEGWIAALPPLMSSLLPAEVGDVLYQAFNGTPYLPAFVSVQSTE
jgi:transposase-like protein